MKNMWQYLGQTYRHAAADGDAGGGGGGAGDAGAGDTGAGDGDAGGETGSGDAGAGGGEGAGGDGAGGTGDAGGDGDVGGQAAADGDWRKSIAGDDAAKLSRLERYTTVEDWNASAFEAHAKVRSGEISTGLPEDPTEEQLKNYREANNIPVDGKYNIELEGGMTLPDSESDMVDKFLEVSHAGNVPENVVNAQLSVYGTMINQVMDNMKAQDGLDEQQFNQIAKDNWGKDYEVNMSRVHNQMNLIPESVREAFMAARMPDGRAITNSPEIMNWIVSNDRGLNPMDPLPGGSEVSFSSAQQIINECKEMMREDIGAWHKNLEAQERFKQARNWMDKYNRDKEGG